MRNSYQKVQLPVNYAQQLLEREIEVRLARSPFENNLCKLLELYSLGFEYYESLGSYKFKYFQQRMKELFQQQEAEEIKKQQIANSLAQIQQKCHDFHLINSEEARLIDQKCREQQRVLHLKEIQAKTSVKSTNEEIRALLLSGDYKAIEVYTRVKLEIDFQQKILQQKLQMRHRKSMRNSPKKGSLRMNSTKTSLLSQSSRKGEYLEEIKQNIFDRLIHENDEESLEMNKENRSSEEGEKPKFIFIKEANCQ